MRAIFYKGIRLVQHFQELLTPFARLTKAQIVRRGLELNKAAPARKPAKGKKKAPRPSRETRRHP